MNAAVSSGIALVMFALATAAMLSTAESRHRSARVIHDVIDRAAAMTVAHVDTATERGPRAIVSGWRAPSP